MGDEVLNINILDFKKKLSISEKNDLFDLFNKLCLKWGLNQENQNQIPQPNIIWFRSIKNFNLLVDNTEILELEKLEKGHKICIFEAFQLYLHFLKQEIINQAEPNNEYYSKFNKIFESIFYSEQLVRSQIRLSLVFNPDYESFMNDDISLYKFSPQDYTDNTPFQNLLLYLLNLLQQKGYRRYEEDCYQPVFHKSNYTYSWKKVIPIEKFVYKYTQKELHFEQWKNLTSAKDNARQAVEFLKRCDDPQFPPLIKNRHVFAFKNGLYICNKLFENQEQEEQENHENSNINNIEINEEFFEYGELEHHPNKKPSNNIIACKYIDANFEYEEKQTWNEIQTPVIQGILDYQFKSELDFDKICYWMYVFIGRMLYDLNELDYWQVIAFLKGMGGAGKSTIITKVIKEFYENEDVGQLSNDGERQFALSAFYNKKIFIAPEIKGDFTLPQAVLQGIISGEEVSVPIKFKTAETVEWKTPGIMAGNEVPNFTDNSGSVSRRFVVFNFSKKVEKGKSDPLLGQKLKKEIPKIIRKSNLAYLDAVKKFGDKDIWPQLPKYFKQTQEEMSEQTNSLMNYLNSGLIEFSNDIYCQESVFKKSFNQYCKDNNLGIHKFNSDFYNSPFIDAGEKYNVKIQVIKRVRKKYPRKYGRISHGTFIMGLDIVNQEEEEDNEEENLEDGQNKIKI